MIVVVFLDGVDWTGLDCTGLDWTGWNGDGDGDGDGVIFNLLHAWPSLKSDQFIPIG